MAKRNSSEMQTGNAEGQVRRPKKGASFVGGARPSGLWAVPAAVFFFIFGILPLFIVVGLSFFKWNGLGTPQFAGGQYWAQFIHDPKVMKSVGVTLTLTILGIVTQTPLSLLLGAWAAGRQRYRAVYTAIYFIPYLLSGTAIAVAWRAMLDPNFGMPSKMRWLFGDGNIFGNASSAIAVLPVAVHSLPCTAVSGGLSVPFRRLCMRPLPSMAPVGFVSSSVSPSPKSGTR